jgi:hypothetical protein
VHGERLRAGRLDDARHAHRVAPLRARAGADLDRDRHRHRGDHGLDDAADQAFIREQRGPGGHVAHFLGRAAHVDVDDLGAEIHVGARRAGELDRVAAGDLHRDRAGLARVIEAQARLARGGEPGARGDHLGDRERGAEAAGEAAERTIGDAGHGSDKHCVLQRVSAELHRLGFRRRREANSSEK